MDHSTLREDMVDSLEYTLERPLSAAVLTALRTVPRHEFLDESPYLNRPSEVAGTRVLAPRTVAQLLEAGDLRAGCSTLIVGVGVGYTAAAVAEIVGDTAVHAIDIDRSMVYRARQNLQHAGYDGVLVDRADGARGLPSYAPFDRILLEAAVVRPPRRLLAQLTDDGRLVFPRGPGRGEQPLVAIERDNGDTDDPNDVDGNGDIGGNGIDGNGDIGGNDTDGYGDDGIRTIGEFGAVRFRPMLVEGEQASGRERNRTRREDAEFATQGYFAKHGWEHEWIDWDAHR
ncbi:MAG: protein-L-isoaspartate O-methyltransferase family protein [Halobacteriota archaeon]